MKDISDIRRGNLQAIINAKTGGNRAAFASEVGRKPQQIGGMLNGSKSFGTKIAREIESLLGLELGALDDENMVVTAKNFRSASGDAPDEGWVRVPVYAVEGSCHDGVFENQSNSIDIVRSIDFLTSFLRTLPGVIGVNHLHIVTANGDSMEPTIPHRALCLVDGGQRDISRDGIFCIQADGQIFIKRVQRNIDRTLTLISDNQRYKPQTISREHLDAACVIGAVVYVFSGREC